MQYENHNQDSPAYAQRIWPTAHEHNNTELLPATECQPVIFGYDPVSEHINIRILLM